MWKIVGIALGLLGLTLLMPWIFYSWIDPSEEYQLGIVALPLVDRIFSSIVDVGLLGLAVWSLNLVRDRVAFWPAAVMFATMIVPNVVVGPLLYREDQWTIIEVNVVLVGCYVLFVAMAAYVERKFVAYWADYVGLDANAKEGASWLAHQSTTDALDWAFVLFVLLGTVFIVTSLGVNVNLEEGFSDVYVARLLLRDTQLGFLGYVIAWIIVMAPAAIYGVIARNLRGVAIAMALTLVVETLVLISSSFKVGIWHAVLPAVYFLLRNLEHRTRLLVIVWSVFLLAVVFPPIGATVPVLESVFWAVPRRVIYATGFLHGFSVEFFMALPPFNFEDLTSFFTGNVVDTRYTFILGSLVGVGFESNANVGFLTDGYINARFIGMVGVAIVAAGTVGILGGLSIVGRSMTGLLFLISLGQLYAEAAAHQVYLTGGVSVVAVFLVLKAIFAKKGLEQASGRGTAASDVVA